MDFSVVWRSVCLSRRWVLQKWLNRSWCCLGLTREGRIGTMEVHRNHRRGPAPHTGRCTHTAGSGNFEEKIGRPNTCPAVDILNAAQQGAAPVRCGAGADSGVLDRGAHTDTWRIGLNRPCEAAMRPYDKLLSVFVQAVRQRRRRDNGQVI